MKMKTNMKLKLIQLILYLYFNVYWHSLECLLYQHIVLQEIQILKTIEETYDVNKEGINREDKQSEQCYYFDNSIFIDSDNNHHK